MDESIGKKVKILNVTEFVIRTGDVAKIFKRRNNW
jgi:hypothetical protein